MFFIRHFVEWILKIMFIFYNFIYENMLIVCITFYIFCDKTDDIYFYNGLTATEGQNDHPNFIY